MGGRVVEGLRHEVLRLKGERDSVNDRIATAELKFFTHVASLLERGELSPLQAKDLVGSVQYTVPGKGQRWLEASRGVDLDAEIRAEQLRNSHSADGLWRGSEPLQRDHMYPPEGPGVYHLHLRGALQYIGSTGCLRNRLQYHRRQKKFDSWIFEPCSTRDQAFKLEADLIDELNPPLNLIGGRR